MMTGGRPSEEDVDPFSTGVDSGMAIRGVGFRTSIFFVVALVFLPFGGGGGFGDEGLSATAVFLDPLVETMMNRLMELH
ncbi:hypothetical protein Syun_006965 [Stephania yunnanensis]|uniref:Transmembrane protein n=1 Tax=Stephania yunnanensis TaxID=152371 RepID=A0AAP0KZC0_9MAGN